MKRMLSSLWEIVGKDEVVVTMGRVDQSKRVKSGVVQEEVNTFDGLAKWTKRKDALALDIYLTEKCGWTLLATWWWTGGEAETAISIDSLRSVQAWKAKERGGRRWISH